MVNRIQYIHTVGVVNNSLEVVGTMGIHLDVLSQKKTLRYIVKYKIEAAAHYT